MAEGKFTKEHVEALEKAIAEKQANPGMVHISDLIDADTHAEAATPAVAAAVAALVGADAKPIDPHDLIGKVSQGGFSLDDLKKARDHALKNSN